MVYIFHSSFHNTVVKYLTAIAFTTVTLAPPHLVATHANIITANANIDLATINFGIKVEKIFEKIKKCIDNGNTNKIIGYMFDVKHEVEQYTGMQIDIDKQLKQVQKEAKSQGQNIDDKYIKQIKKDFHREDKKRNHRVFWFSKCTDVGIPYSTAEADVDFDANYLMAKSAKTEDIDVPIPVMVGVTVSLCGLFLFFVPFPGCQTAGVWLINTGVGILGSEAIQKWDQYDKSQR